MTTGDNINKEAQTTLTYGVNNRFYAKRRAQPDSPVRISQKARATIAILAASSSIAVQTPGMAAPS